MRWRCVNLTVLPCWPVRRGLFREGGRYPRPPGAVKGKTGGGAPRRL